MPDFTNRDRFYTRHFKHRNGKVTVLEYTTVTVDLIISSCGFTAYRRGANRRVKSTLHPRKVANSNSNSGCRPFIMVSPSLGHRTTPQLSCPCNVSTPLLSL